MDSLLIGHLGPLQRFTPRLSPPPILRAKSRSIALQFPTVSARLGSLSSFGDHPNSCPVSRGCVHRGIHCSRRGAGVRGLGRALYLHLDSNFSTLRQFFHDPGQIGLAHLFVDRFSHSRLLSSCLHRIGHNSAWQPIAWNGVRRAHGFIICFPTNSTSEAHQ